ncbi:MAG: ATP-dependent DNA helicase RecG [Spirochaetes bacterium]|nr:ATP-dependent DNA helicase RecG [Spirochaetota bacterium]
MKLSDISIKNIPGIGDKKFSVFAGELDIRTVEDLLFFRPRRYIDRSALLKIKDIRPSQNEISVIGEITGITSIKTPRNILKIEISDGTGILEGIFFGGIKYFAKIFESGDTVIFSGKPELNYGRIKIVHPEFDFIYDKNDAVNTARIVPVYPLTETLRNNFINSRFLRKIMKYAADNFIKYADCRIPDKLIVKYNLIEYKKALFYTHFPENEQQIESSRKRLAFNELFYYVFFINISKELNRKKVFKAQIQFNEEKFNAVQENLPFKLISDQENALQEIKKDILSPDPMNRLLQGDVGSGKTVVAVLAIAIHVLGGGQAAFMAPTEVLARQHFYFCEKYLGPFFKVDYLSGSNTASERENIYLNLENGTTGLIIGTHALFQENVKFKNLKFIVIDEQHRFGVEQRLRLYEKGRTPDLLVMTATPIPRSLALTVFGDLDVSVIREKPAGRQPVKTLLFSENRMKGVYNSINKYLSTGRQCYYVLPLIEESEKSDLKSAKEMYNKLTGMFKEHRVAILHGKMNSEEKISIMNEFKLNEIQILVSTTVIEVGIDVPNANIIVVHHAERFGLSQLHQLRGRVGRGEHESFCVLIYPESCDPETVERLSFLENCSDGFLISEKDLQTRGSGQLTGLIQHGFKSEFDFLNPVDDTEMIINARNDISAIISTMNIDVESDNIKRIISEKNILKNSGEKIYSILS